MENKIGSKGFLYIAGGAVVLQSIVAGEPFYFIWTTHLPTGTVGGGRVPIHNSQHDDVQGNLEDQIKSLWVSFSTKPTPPNPNILPHTHGQQKFAIPWVWGTKQKCVLETFMSHETIWHHLFSNKQTVFIPYKFIRSLGKKNVGSPNGHMFQRWWLDDHVNLLVELWPLVKFILYKSFGGVVHICSTIELVWRIFRISTK